jgi:hypothetical protein
MIDAIAFLAPPNLLRTAWLLRLVLIAGFPLASTAPLLGGLLASQGPISRQQRELAEEEIAIRCPVTSSIRRVAETGGTRYTVPGPSVRVRRSHSKCASTPAGALVTFRAAGHRLELATSAPLLC